MPNKVEITEAGKNTVQVSTSPVTVDITETTHTVEIAALTRAVGNATISSGIDITNTIGDALAGGTYASGTTLEAIVRDLIAPFLEPSFASVSMSATGAHQANGQELLVECGLAATLTGLTITWTNPENLDDNTNLTIRDQSTVPPAEIANQDIADYGALSVPYTQTVSYAVPIVNSPTVRNIKLGTGYLGNNGQGSLVSIVQTVHIAHRHRVYVISSEQDTLPSGLGQGTRVGALLATATEQATGSTLLSTLAVDQNVASQTLTVQCDAGSADTDNFTWILIPSAGTLGEVAAEINGRGVADYTDSWQLDDNSGNGYIHAVGTANPVYKAYRSIQTGAFDSDVTLQIEILH